MAEFEWSAIGTIGTWSGVALTVGAGLLALGRVKKTAEDAEKKADEAVKSIADFRTEAAEKFVTVTMMERIEEKVFAAIEKMGDRFDQGFARLGERLDRILENHNLPKP